MERTDGYPVPPEEVKQVLRGVCTLLGTGRRLKIKLHALQSRSVRFPKGRAIRLIAKQQTKAAKTLQSLLEQPEASLF